MVHLNLSGFGFLFSVMTFSQPQFWMCLGTRLMLVFISSRFEGQDVSYFYYRPHCTTTYVDAVYCYRVSRVVC